MLEGHMSEGGIMSVKQKYLRDENGDIFSPIVSASSIITSRDINSSTTIEQILPYTYRVNSVDGYSTNLKIFDGSVYNWTMIKIHLLLKTSTTTTSKSIYFRFNNSNTSGGYAIDARRRDANWSSYNPVPMSSNVFLGDVAYDGNSSYLEATIINGGTWHPYKSSIGTATSTSDDYSISACSGQFSHSGLGAQLQSIYIPASQGIQAKGIVQIYT